MATIKDLIHTIKPITGDTITSLGQMWYGKIVAPLPVLLTDMMYVNIPDIDANAVIGPARWPLSDVPHIGDDCLVTFDSRQNAWVIAIWPT